MLQGGEYHGADQQGSKRCQKCHRVLLSLYWIFGCPERLSQAAPWIDWEEARV
jgi:hypothetical protein